MNRDLFLAILSMDSYNRGYGRGIKFSANDIASNKNEVGVKIGNAIVTQQDNSESAVAAGFYAIAYDMTGVAGFADGERVISYRGTDRLFNNPFGNGPGSDFWAYGIGVGQPFALTGGLTDQARLTIEFFRAVAGDGADPFAANITTTGHSLGGGLAGYAAMLYGKQSTIFANMAFEDAAENTRRAASLGSMIGVDQTLVYGSGPINATDRTGISGLAVVGEGLGYAPFFNRARQATEVTPPSSRGSRSAGDLHAMSLHVALLWDQIHGTQNWTPAGEQLWDAFFDSAVANAIAGIGDRTGKDKADVDTMGRMIAYSAIDEGERPFGDTGISNYGDSALIR